MTRRLGLGWRGTAGKQANWDGYRRRSHGNSEAVANRQPKIAQSVLLSRKVDYGVSNLRVRNGLCSKTLRNVLSHDLDLRNSAEPLVPPPRLAAPGTEPWTSFEVYDPESGLLHLAPFVKGTENYGLTLLDKHENGYEDKR